MFKIKKDKEIFSCTPANIEGFSNNSKSNVPSYVCLPVKKTLKKKQIEKFENNDKNMVCGVNSGDAIYCADDNIESNPNWFQVPGGLQNVSVSNGRLYGTNSANNIYYADNYKNAQWAQIPGGLKQVSLDGKSGVVVGVNSGDAIYYADQNIQNNPHWTQVPGALINVSVSNGQLYGCNRGNNIYYAANYKNAQWVQIPGSLSQVSLDGYNQVVCGVNSNQDIWCADQNITSNPNWFQVPGKLIWVSISNGKLYGVNSANNIFYASDYKNARWVQVPGGLKQVSLDYNSKSLLSLGCEGQSTTVKCPSGQTIAGGTVKYGRWNNNVCAHGTVNGNTAARVATGQLPNKCIGQNSCDLTIDNGFGFGDPYGGVYKHFEVSPQCVSSKSINIVEASYGINCNGGLKGNRTELFKRLMNGKPSIQYKFDYTQTGGDPAGGCGKTLEVKFHCGDNNIQTLVVPAEAGYNGAVNINCSEQVQQVKDQVVQVTKSVAQNQSTSSGLAKYVRLGGGNDWINLSQLVVKDSNGVNVSKGRPTTSSGVGAGGEESNAVDGDEQPRHHPRGYHSSSNKDAFFQITLDNPTNVSSVTVYGRNDFGGRMVGHKITLLDSNNKVIFTSNDLNADLKQTINISGSNKSGSVKYVKLGGGNDWINLSQLVVFDSNGGNIAKGRPTKSSGVGFGGEEHKAVDGSEQPRGHPNEYHSSSDKNAFFEVELEKPSSVSSVVVYNRSDCCSSRMASGHKIYLLDSNRKVLFESNNLNAELKQVINIPKLNESFTDVNYNEVFYSAFGKLDELY